MYTDRKKIFSAIILICIAIVCIVALFRGRTEGYFYIGIIVSLLLAFSFLRNLRH